MAGVELLQHDFTAGIRRARARDDLGRQQGANVLWDCRDWIIGRLGVPLAKRGGWGYQGGALASSPGRVRALCDGPFNGGHYLIAVEADGTIQRATGPGFSTWSIDVTTVNAGTIRQNPIFFLDNMLIPSNDGTSDIISVNEDHAETKATGTYQPTYLESHRGRVWGIDGEILIAGPAGNPVSQSWDNDGAYDISQPGKGLVSINKSMLIFFDGSTERLVGATPGGYGVTTDDIEIQRFSGDVGCIDAFSICQWQGTAIWADKNGVWISNGDTFPLDLTTEGSAKDLYVDFMRDYVDVATTRVAAGIFSDLLFVTMTNSSTNAFINCLVCDLPQRKWYRMKNFPFSTFMRNSIGAPETWGGVETVAGRVATLSGILNPTSSNYADADGTDVEPDFETAYYRFGPMPSRLTRLFLGYEIDFLGTAASLVNQNITYTAVETGTYGNSITVRIITTGAGSAATVAVTQRAIVVTIGSTTTKASIASAIAASRQAAALITAVVAGGHDSDTGVSALAATALASGTSTDCDIKVDFTTDPKKAPTFRSDAATTFEVEPVDIHGNEDRGYHWKPIPVRQFAPGLAARVRVVGPSAKLAVHALGSEATPAPTYTQV